MTALGEEILRDRMLTVWRLLNIPVSQARRSLQPKPQQRKQEGQAETGRSAPKRAEMPRFLPFPTEPLSMERKGKKERGF